MTTPAFQPPPLVSLELDADELAFGKFLSVTETFFDLLREVTAAVVRSGDVHWVLDDISMGSPVQLGVRPVAATDDVSPADLDDATAAFVNGVATVQRTPHRPDYFSDRALERARRLATEAVSPSSRLRLSRPARRGVVNVTTQLIANIDSLLGETSTEIGTVEGRLEAFNVHGNNRYFNVYDALTGERIRCDFAHRIDAREVGAAAERRVAVHGEIEYRESGEIVKIKAHSLEVFPAEDDLPSSESVRGIIEA